jgi:hypothetical protein
VSSYADRTMERERKSRVRRQAPAGGFIWVMSSWTVDHITHWPHLAVIGLSGAVSAVLMVAAMITQDTWPRPVPPELASRVAKLRGDHWRTARIHPWWKCTSAQEKQPHVHMISPEGEHRIVTGPRP